MVHEMKDIIAMQVTMFALIFIGMMAKKRKLVSEEGQKNITDLVIYIVLTCNILWF